MKRLTILKLGGSVLTLKGKPFEANLKNIRRLAGEIAEGFKRGGGSLILVHGAGSFGHPLVLESRIHEGIKSREQLLSFAMVQSWQNYWNFIVTSELQRKKLPAFPCQASASAVVERGKIVWMETKLIEEILRIGLIPVLYGVPAYDRVQKCSILSGDEIVAYLAEKLGASRVIHGTDVDGVFTGDPNRDPAARLIKEITRDNVDEVRRHLSKSTQPDVTGGMAGKISRLIRVAEKGVVCLIVNANRPGIVEKALIGEKVPGTVIRF